MTESSGAGRKEDKWKQDVVLYFERGSRAACQPLYTIGVFRLHNYFDNFPGDVMRYNGVFFVFDLYFRPSRHPRCIKIVFRILIFCCY